MKKKQFTFGDYKQEITKVTFMRPVPKFIAVDMKIYGEFKEGDVAYLPEIHARNLKKKGACI